MHALIKEFSSVGGGGGGGGPGSTDRKNSEKKSSANVCQMLISIETYRAWDFPGGSDPYLPSGSVPVILDSLKCFVIMFLPSMQIQGSVFVPRHNIMHVKGKCKGYQIAFTEF